MELQKVDTGTYIESTAMDFKATKSAYALSPTTPYNLLLCRNLPSFDKFWVVAMSKSGNTYTVADSYGVKSLTLPWLASQSDMCLSVGAASPGTSNNRGYASDDLITGPWRNWTGTN